MTNSKVLVIVESPNKIQSLKSFLPKNYTVMASVGHISEINNGGTYWNTGIDPQNNFEADFAVSDEKKEVVARLKEKVKESDIVILCSDPDREGEAIAWSLKKFLKIPNSKCKRATFHEITKSAVLKALQETRDIDADLVDASHARMKLDKLLGYRLSPIARRAINARSVGRCQSAGLKLIVQREEEIQNFKSEKYAELFLEFAIEDEKFKAKYFSEDKRLSLEEVKDIVKDCDIRVARGAKYIIEDVETKEKYSNPKLPFITSTFQQEVSSKLNISVKRAMEYAQRLFEGLEVNHQHIGLITYMRTDSTEMSEEFKATLATFVKDRFGDKYYQAPRKAKKNDLSQDGHECLRVVDLSMTPSKLSQYIEDKNLIRVYDIIYRRTVASSMSSAITRETTYTISLDNHKFKLVSKELMFDGYQKVYVYKDKDDEELYKHVFKKNDTLNKYEPELNIVEKQTQPPARYKEATFLKELETSGIGRPSTFATIVTTLLDTNRGYCTVEDKYIVPTELGIELSHFLDKNFGDLINVDYTKEMETDLDKIANGKMKEIDFLTEFFNNMESTIKKYEPAGKQSENTDVKCPKCGKSMKLRKGPYGEFYGCTGYPNCKTIVNIDKK